MKKLMSEHKIDRAVFKYEDKYDKLSKIKDSYAKQVAKITAQDVLKDCSQEDTIKNEIFQIKSDKYPSK